MDRISETPTVVIDEKRLRANVDRMQEIAARNGLTLSPHIKSHKSLELARIQLDAGAFALTASKPEEALVFIGAGLAPVTVAYPLVHSRTVERLVDAADTAGVAVRFVVDSSECLAALIAASDRTGRSISMFIEIDVGLGRCGLGVDSPLLTELAHSIGRHRRLALAGILSHAGQAYAADGRDAVARIAETERTMMLEARAVIMRLGLEVPILSVGSTPTVLAATSFEGIDEIRPGNYIVLDGIQVALGIARYDDVALTVLATIVSRNASHYIVDAGSKTLSSDRGAHGAERPVGHGAAFVGDVLEGAEWLPVVRLSEEHGFVERRGTDLPIGARLRIVPNHACPVVNLAKRMVLVGDEIREIAVDAAGCVH